MKKSIILLAALSLPAIAGLAAEVPENVVYQKGIYTFKISPNGLWFGSQGGVASTYNSETGKVVYYEDMYIGNGNAISDNGLLVGTDNTSAVIMKDGEAIHSDSFSPYWGSYINAITRDGSRITGFVNGQRGADLMYIPFVADVDADGNVGELTILPHPKIDLFGSAAPQSVVGHSISDDGKSIIGEVTDWRGMFSYPIYFVQDDKGEWDYFLPTEQLFNPTGIDIPRNPWLDEPKYPEPEDFMTNPLLKQAYEAAMEKWEASGYNGTQPNPSAYMTEEDYANYEKAVEDYNEWYYGRLDDEKAYVQLYIDVLRSSPGSSGGEMALHGSGDYFVARGTVLNENFEMVGTLYKFNRDGSYETLGNLTEEGLFPNQVLSDGTIVLTKAIMAVPDSYFLFPDKDELVSLQDYLKPDHPEISNWIDSEFFGNGIVVVSDDMSVMGAGLTPDHYIYYDAELADYLYSSYIITGLKNTGVEGIEAENPDGIYKVYNLEGMKVLETKDASALNGLAKGIYIVNGKKVKL